MHLMLHTKKTYIFKIVIKLRITLEFFKVDYIVHWNNKPYKNAHCVNAIINAQYITLMTSSMI